MNIGDMFELLLTFLVLMAVWVVPRLALGARKRTNSRGKTQNAAPAEGPGDAGPPWNDYDREVAAPVPRFEEPVVSGPPGAKRSGARREEHVSVFADEQPPPVSVAANLRPSRRANLRRAVLWKEILDPPKALRHFSEEQ